jgi:1,4-alpha-glucan branching enzyme
MGEEILEDKQWRDDTNFHANLLIWWDGLSSDKPMQDYLRFCHDLVWLRRNNAAFRSESLRVATCNSVDRVISIHRWIEGVGQDIVVVANLQEMNRFGYRIGFPGGGRWREIFNSDFYDQFPNPQVTGNSGSISSDTGSGLDDMPSSAAVNLPANGFIVFAR